MADHMDGVKPGKLFAGSCIALIATAMTFAVLSSIINPLKEQFLLTNQNVGWIAGAGLAGFPISIIIFGPLCSVLGMRFLLRLAFVFFAAGISLMVFASGFWMLFFGALTIAFANGLVEGACNPLVATLYPDRKVQKLNQFHVWFPGGIVIGGLLCFFLDRSSLALALQDTAIKLWQIKVGAIMIPAIVMAFVMLAEKFPKTERDQHGVSFMDMVMGTFGRPLFYVLFITMMLTASLELGPNRWIPSIMDSAGFGGANAGILLLVWTSLLMALLRQFAGPVVAKFSPTGMLLGSCILAGIGLFMLSVATSSIAILAADTIFAVGVCYFWPTMLGVASERVPRGGELAMAMLGVAGNVAAGFIASPLMGHVGDVYGHEKFPYAETRAVIQRIADELPAEKANTKFPDVVIFIDQTVAQAKQILADADATQTLPVKTTANILRGAINAAPMSGVGGAAKQILSPSEAYGGRIAFRYVSAISLVLLLVFGFLYIRDKSMGGYKAEKLAA